jgi:hypothetical protein
MMTELDIISKHKKDRDQYWAMLQRAKRDFMRITDQSSLEYEAGDGAFYYYLQRNYGLRMELIDGKITAHYEVVDDAKYLMFVMKYGS